MANGIRAGCLSGVWKKSEPMRTDEHYARLDCIAAISDLISALKALSQEERLAVILYALSFSRFQFTWSFMAETFEIPRRLWPAQVLDSRESGGE